MDYVEIIFSFSIFLVTVIGIVLLLEIRQNSRKLMNQIKKTKVKVEALKNETQQGKTKLPGLRQRAVENS